MEMRQSRLVKIVEGREKKRKEKLFLLLRRREVPLV